jgi:hypothetical protein
MAEGRIAGAESLSFSGFMVSMPSFYFIKSYPFYLAGLRRAEREDPTVHGGDESGALCPSTKNHKSDKGTNDLITCTAQ